MYTTRIMHENIVQQEKGSTVNISYEPRLEHVVHNNIES
jgi:hypothetical protein